MLTFISAEKGFFPPFEPISKGRDQTGGLWNHSPGIRDHKSRDRDQQFFLGIRDPAVPFL